MMVLEALAYDNGDFQFWNSDSVEVKITDPLKAKIEQEFRFGDDMSELYYLHTDGGLYLKVTDGLTFAANYRQVYEKKGKDKWEREYRPHLNATVSWEWFDFKFSDRNRLEYRMYDVKDDKWRYRNKLTAKFPWKWTALEIQPYMSDEIFVDFYGKRLTRNRVYGGLEMKLLKHLKTDLFYMWQTSKDEPGKWTGWNVLGLKIKAVF